MVVERLGDGTLAATARGVTIAVGRGGPERLTSVELLLAALGSCTLGTVLDYAGRVGIELDGARVELAPVLDAKPERVAEICMTLKLAGDISEPRLGALRRVAAHCKLHATLVQGLSLALTVEHEDA
ncbi:MAG: OsmC family protein [Solirubrobacteraceae bacterium]